MPSSPKLRYITLTTWFRDYIYIPLGGSRVGKWKSVRNTFIIFLVSGFWHGANWTFICWGLFHALLFLPLLLTSSNRKYRGIVAEGKLLPSWKEAIQNTLWLLPVLSRLLPLLRFRCCHRMLLSLPLHL